MPVNLVSPALCLRNSGLNLATRIANLALGFVVVPFVVRGLGDEAYGFLALVWIVVGYFGLFDLSISRATIKYLAEHVARSDAPQITRTLWTSVLSNFALGMVAAAALAGLALIPSARMLPTAGPLAGEARWAVAIAAAALPFSMAQGAILGVPAALQRFDVINALDLGYSVLRQLGTLALVWAGSGLLGVVIATTALSILSSIAYLLVARRLLPDLGWRITWDRASLRRLVSFGSWVTVSQLVNPVLLYLDRFCITWLLSVAAVTYYTVPFEMAMRLALIPASLTATLFPAFSAETALDARSLGSTQGRFLKYLLFAMAPLAGLLVLFAREIFELWLGPEFGRQSTAPLQILAVAVLLSSLARVPAAALQAAGRPDLPAKIQLAELAIHGAACWLLISWFGLVGAALAALVRAAIECVLLGVVSFRFFRITPGQGFAEGVPQWAAIAVIAAAALLLSRAALPAPAARAASACAAVSAYLILIWRYGLTRDDREAFSLAASLRSKRLLR